jgi:hypothetical protein
MYVAEADRLNLHTANKSSLIKLARRPYSGLSPLRVATRLRPVVPWRGIKQVAFREF